MLRADAQDNRDRVLDAARALFSERGIDVPMREIARHADVGPATLYRRFPTRHALIEEVFSDERNACGGIVDEGVADPDPWRGFCTVIERIFVLNARNQGFVDAFLAEHPDHPETARHRELLLRQLTGLARRAQAAGRLRADFVINDLVLVLLAVRGLSVVASASREAAARRFATLAIDGFRAFDPVYLDGQRP